MDYPTYLVCMYIHLYVGISPIHTIKSISNVITMPVFAFINTRVMTKSYKAFVYVH